MTRLISFGCSFTYGHGLEDCFVKETNNPGEYPSKFSWPYILSKKLGIECINMGKPGASNFEILEKILNFNFLKTDIMITMWSYYSRDLVYDENKKPIRLLTGVNSEKYIHWVELHSNYDLILKSWFYMHHAHQYMKNLDIKFYFLSNSFVDENFQKNKPKWAHDINLFPTNFEILNRTYPRALDNCHPGPKAHIAAAEEIFNYILK